MTALPPHAFAAHFGTSRLSERKAEVAQLILQGHSSKVIARMLGNSPETVKVFRKRIHTKQGLATSAELFSLFLAALCAAPHGSTDDPLIHLN